MQLSETPGWRIVGKRAREACDSANLSINSMTKTTVARFAGSSRLLSRSWGFASLHPRLYAVARLAGSAQLAANTTYRNCDAYHSIMRVPTNKDTIDPTPRKIPKGNII